MFRKSYRLHWRLSSYTVMRAWDADPHFSGRALPVVWCLGLLDELFAAGQLQALCGLYEMVGDSWGGGNMVLDQARIEQLRAVLEAAFRSGRLFMVRDASPIEQEIASSAAAAGAGDDVPLNEVPALSPEHAAASPQTQDVERDMGAAPNVPAQPADPFGPTQAQALIEAAKNGTPFCEVCARS